MNEVVDNEAELEKIVKQDLSKAEKSLNEELKKAEGLKNKLDKMINNTKKISNSSITSWWNGMGYDF